MSEVECLEQVIQYVQVYRDTAAEMKARPMTLHDVKDLVTELGYILVERRGVDAEV